MLESSIAPTKVYSDTSPLFPIIIEDTPEVYPVVDNIFNVVLCAVFVLE